MGLNQPDCRDSGNNSAIIIAALITAIASVISTLIVVNSPTSQNHYSTADPSLALASNTKNRVAVEDAQSRWRCAERALDDFRAGHDLISVQKSNAERRYYDAQNAGDNLISERIRVDQRIAQIPLDATRTRREITELELEIPVERDLLKVYEVALSTEGSLEQRLTFVTGRVDQEIVGRIESQLLRLRLERANRDNDRRQFGPQSLSYSTHDENADYGNAKHKITKQIESQRPQIRNEIQKPIISQFEFESTRISRCKRQPAAKTHRLDVLKEKLVQLDEELALLQARLSIIPVLFERLERDLESLELSYTEVVEQWRSSNEVLLRLRDNEEQARGQFDQLNRSAGIASL